MPTLFNQRNPLVKLLTQFQLEANNQFFKDVPRACLVFKDEFIKLESITGRSEYYIKE
jgi:hypothetical protein